MKNITKLFGIIVLTFTVLFTAQVNAQTKNALPGAQNGVITLEADTTYALSSKYVIPKNVTKIDLNGGIITSTAKDQGIRINANTTITITDSSVAKTGSIKCSNGNACIYNAGTLTLDNVKVSSTNIATVRNDNRGKLVITNSNIEAENCAVHNFGKATITDSNLSAKTYGVVNAGSDKNTAELAINGGKISGAEAVHGVSRANSKNTVNLDGVDVKGNITMEKDANGNNSKLILENMSDESIENALINSKDGSEIVLPEDFNGEIPEGSQTKIVSSNGNEVVFITFNGRKYQVEKGKNWSNGTTWLPKKDRLNMALAHERDNTPNRVFAGFFNKANNTQVTKNTKWNNDAEVYIKWKVVVILDGVAYTLELDSEATATKIGNAISSDEKKLSDTMKVVPVGKNSVYFIDENGNRVYATTTTNSNMTIASKYTVQVKVNDKIVTPDAGTKVKNVQLLSEIAKEENFAYFIDTKGNKYTLETELNNNVSLKPIYRIEIKVAPFGDVSIGVGYVEYVDLTNGVTLRDILEASYGSNLQAYLDVEGFIGFFDEEGHMIGLDDVITSSINLKAKFLRQPENGQEIDQGFGKPIQELPENPKTFDGIGSSLAMMIGSLFIMLLATIALIKAKLFN